MSKEKRSKVKTEMFLHSEAKVQFYKKYLERYLTILYLSPVINEIYIFDVFCGTGIYDNGKKGSPIVAYDEIIRLKDSYPKNNTKINLVINDEDATKVEKVKKYIENSTDDFFKFHPRSKGVDELLPQLVSFFNLQKIQVRNLLFIDPYGYKEIKRDLIENLMANGRTEIILFLPISQMQRFTMKAMESEEQMYSHLRNFIFSFFPEEHPIKKQKIHALTYIKYIAEALKFNKYFTTSYYIERDSKNYYGLFFISNNIFGFEKILEVKWNLDLDDGRGYQLPKPQGLFSDFFKEEKEQSNYDKLQNLLLAYLNPSNKNNIELYEFTLQNEFLPSHLVKLINKLAVDEIVEIFDENGIKIKKITNKMISFHNYKNKNEICLLKIKS